ncbi:MAG: NAD(P)-dependent oxidoreductase [SAR324 cluster bacterium]|nr:NAD(P)-dependent oxidoreductase [SAR324 cluster bacterium]
MGALEYHPAEQIGDNSERHNELDIHMLAELADLVMSKQKNKQQQLLKAQTRRKALNLIRVGSSAGGARSKALVALSSDGRLFDGSIDHGIDYTYWILKFDNESTSSPGLKQTLAEKAAERALDFADIALMAVVPGNGIRNPALVSGTGAERFLRTFGPLGMSVESLGLTAGDAATRKLLRSVFMKDLAAVMIEALSAAQKAGMSEWLWQNLATEISRADGSLLHRLVTATGLHAQRSQHE